MRKNDLTVRVDSFSKRMKNTWQVVFLPSVVLYALSLLHLLYAQPSPHPALRGYLNNIDLVSYIIAIVLTVMVFTMKRKYFSRRFSRTLIERSLEENPQQDHGELLSQILTVLRQKMTLVWVLGFLLVLDGVLFYWVTFSNRNSMHIYFVIGVFSLLINYPRRDLFSDLPWYVIETKKDFDRTKE